jgi:nucleotidyltransferase/DNA polymerase involved in DNA repair
VTDIIGEGLGSVAELQQVVAEAIVAVQTASPVANAIRSPRAKESVASVPTLGPGMVWRLNQLGIRTLGDLADMEVEDLRAKLGPVAKLVRVEAWIDYAKAA